MKILGIDPSFTSTGYAIIEDGKLLDYGEIKTSNKANDNARMLKIYNSVGRVLYENNDIDIACIEAPAYGAKFASFKTMTANVVCRVVCAHAKVGYMDIPPTSLKRLFAGSGNASKADMIRAASEKYHVTVGDDIADAIALAEIMYKYMLTVSSPSQETFSKWYRLKRK